MKEQGFTLIELLAVIVILAIIALIATPIILNIISNTKENAGLRSAEMYLDAVEQSVALERMTNTTFNPNKCDVTNEGNLFCEGYQNKIDVKVNGEKPNNGSIAFTEGKIKEVELKYENGKTIVMNNDGDLEYKEETSEGSGSELDLSTVDATLSNNSWETIQKVVKAGKVAKAGWSVGDTKTLTINGQEKEATLIGINHDGENTLTFMVMSDIGSHIINSERTTDGGWEASEMRLWLNNDIYNSMSNKNYIKEVTKMSNNTGYLGSKSTQTQDKLFLLSVVETGLNDNYDVNGEGTVYEWFTKNSLKDDCFWLRSAPINNLRCFFSYSYGGLYPDDVDGEESVFPAFVIG